LSPWNLDALADLEAEYGCRVYTVLQLRLIETLQNLRQAVRTATSGPRPDICLTYVTRRGAWYDVSWKGDPAKSGGAAMNIGVHFFDLLLWMFGDTEHSEVHLHSPRRMAGVLELERARVRWFLSVDGDDLPADVRRAGKFAHRSMTLDGEEVEFSDGFTDLHTKAYAEILAGRGAGIADARPAIELVHAINAAEVTHGTLRHPLLENTVSHAAPALRRA
jgi:UDP-N-acetyl-2-amino-2-deoxyglucuronate dehydrogenase